MKDTAAVYVVKIDTKAIVDAAKVTIGAIEALQSVRDGLIEKEQDRMGALMSKGLSDGCSIDIDPPSYLPMREHPAPRIPDLCPDDMMSAFVARGNAAMGKRLGPTLEKAEAIITLEHDGNEYVVSDVAVVVTPLEPHNPETCRDPACECWPF